MFRGILMALGLCPLLVLIGLQLWDSTGSTTASYWASMKSVLGHSSQRHQIPIVMACMPAFGHMEKIGPIAQGLAKLGHPVTLITGLEFEDQVKGLGLTFEPLDGSGKQMMTNEELAEFLTMDGLDQELFAIKAVFLNALPDHARTVQRVFSKHRAADSAAPLVFVYDSSFQGVAPVQLGAPGIRPDVSVGIGLAPYTAASNDTMPFRSGRRPDTGPNSREVHRDAQLRHNAEPFYKNVDIAYKGMLSSMGATSPIPTISDAFSLLPDILLQHGIPDFEYRRSDFRPNLTFIGVSPKVGLAAQDLPSWWNDVLAAEKSGKRIIAVTSSSVDFNVEHLIIPALEALKDRADLLVVATLVTSDVESFPYDIPTNARVAKFIPLDLLLPYVSVLVSNGGYGTVQQALANGVPMVLSGAGQDKAQTGPIAEYAGVGIYHNAQKTSADMVRNSVDEILKNKSFSDRSRELAKAYRNYDTVAIVDQTIQKAIGELGR